LIAKIGVFLMFDHAVVIIGSIAGIIVVLKVVIVVAINVLMVVIVVVSSLASLLLQWILGVRREELCVVIPQVL